ncbi:MAG: hypothetical protein R3E02_09720 [Blastomonas sp.]
MFDSDIIWILIPLAPFLLGGLAIWTKHQSKMLDKRMELARLEAERSSAGGERLEQRVRTLERIITDDRNDLAQQIEDLRNEPLN